MLGVSLLGSGMTALYMRNAGDKTRRGETSNASQDSPPPAAQLLERTIIVQQPTPADSKSNSSEERSIARTQSAPVALDIERAERVSEAFEGDKMGDSNSQRNENRFRSALTSPKLDGVELERMECRSRVCRAALSFTNQAADGRAILRLMKETEDNGYSIIIPVRESQSDGTTKATVFLFAPGAMPNMNPSGELAEAPTNP